MPKTLFYFKKMDGWDIWPTLIYSILSLFLVYYYNIGDNITKRGIVPIYGIGTHLFLYMMYYKPLRNLYTYLIWIGISIIHICVYIDIEQDYALKRNDGTVAGILTITLPVLLIFQILRWVSFKMQGKDLVAPVKGGGVDTWDERMVSMTDYLCFIIFILFYIFLITKSF